MRFFVFLEEIGICFNDVEHKKHTPEILPEHLLLCEGVLLVPLAVACLAVRKSLLALHNMSDDNTLKEDSILSLVVVYII